jgi:hypothetical protein
MTCCEAHVDAKAVPLGDGRSCNVIFVEATADSQPRHLSYGTSWLTFITLAPAPEGWAELTREDLATHPAGRRSHTGSSISR